MNISQQNEYISIDVNRNNVCQANYVKIKALVGFQGLLEFFTQSTTQAVFFKALKGQDTCARISIALPEHFQNPLDFKSLLSRDKAGP